MLRDHATSSFNLESLRSVAAWTPFAPFCKLVTRVLSDMWAKCLCRDVGAGGLPTFVILVTFALCKRAHTFYIHAEAAVLRPRFLKLCSLLWILQAKSPFAKCECSKAHPCFFAPKSESARGIFMMYRQPFSQKTRICYFFSRRVEWWSR